MTTSWTDIPKPLPTTSVMSNNFSGGSPIGLLLSLTYSTVTQSSIVTGIWTNISKASGTTYTNIAKAT